MLEPVVSGWASSFARRVRGLVMTIIVTMGVLVYQGLVAMGVSVTLEEQKDYSQHEQQGGEQVDSGNGLTE